MKSKKQWIKFIRIAAGAAIMAGTLFCGAGEAEAGGFSKRNNYTVRVGTNKVSTPRIVSSAVSTPRVSTSRIGTRVSTPRVSMQQVHPPSVRNKIMSNVHIKPTPTRKPELINLKLGASELSRQKFSTIELNTKKPSAVQMSPVESRAVNMSSQRVNTPNISSQYRSTQKISAPTLAK